ncbi:acetyl-CoA carboxylase biotin carboxyl carrier protein [Microcoleus sp. FACHB-1515]|uniref:acetyl-CoA carboxylase biotin carboxyl carrier protein n=1 Tax=Cyanophyceae TaxID=3028117 RepID=UPI001685B9CB|nr:acetyl-CoA carboxylase biotin carboxyl carrier protein [Microcoleus sp. FACHB-1515]MBD2090478.1 acetyl-CoA carboxylase biotin carboxyl carrier protein [Microcoleus sp. FACHB-1515]
MELNFNEIRELLAVLQQTDIAELSIKSSDFELTVRKDRAGSDRPPPPDAPELPSAVAPPPVPVPAAAPTPPPKADRLLEVVSPMVGTFYRAPGPEEPPYVEVGDRIRVGQAVCIIEAMKLMNELEAEVAGEIVEILVQNGQPVEYGQPLMRVNPG